MPLPQPLYSFGVRPRKLDQVCRFGDRKTHFEIAWAAWGWHLDFHLPTPGPAGPPWSIPEDSCR